jgi:hypothetical protein
MKTRNTVLIGTLVLLVLFILLAIQPRAILYAGLAGVGILVYAAVYQLVLAPRTQRSATEIEPDSSEGMRTT